MSVVAISPTVTEGQDNTRDNAPQRSWEAKLELDYQRKRGGTALVRRTHAGPLCVQKPFYPEGPDVCHTYLLHPPAGIAGGDSLEVMVRVGDGSNALITTPAATKFYKANPYAASLKQHIDVNAGASIEWLPQGNIIFDGAESQILTLLKLKRDSKMIAWDSQCLGRPACDETFQRGHYRQRFEIWLEDKPLLIDSLGFAACSAMQTEKWGLAGRSVHAIFAAYPANAALLAMLNEHIETSEEDCAATIVDGLLVVRSFGAELDSVQRRLARLWQLVREPVVGRPPCAPRIWNT